MSRHFGDMLLERRRQLGISIQQVSNIVKIRPQIIEYFETENFSAMPPRGYAQGMIASYARYLSLNPDVVVDAYFDALYEYEHGAGGRVGRFADAAADASPRSSNAPARYMMVNAVPQSRYGDRPPQAGYVSESTSPHEPMSSARLRPSAMTDSRRPPQRAYDPSMRSRTRGSAHPDAYPQRRPDPRGYPSRQRPQRSYDGRRDPRDRGGYPMAGRAPQRSGGYRDGRRRGPATQGRGGHGRQSTPSMGLFDRFDPRMIIAAALIALVIIVLAGFMLLRGCAPEPEAAGSAAPSSSQVDTSKKDPAKDDTSSSDNSSSDDDASSQATDGEDPDGPEDTEPQETIVKVSLKEKGSVAWVEVKLDGKNVLGKQVVGPFEEQFTVSTQIDITTDTPSAVAVYKNGEKVRYDTKVSGVGKVSILAPKKKEEKVVDSDGDGTLDMTASEAKAAGIEVPEGDAAQPTA